MKILNAAFLSVVFAAAAAGAFEPVANPFPLGRVRITGGVFKANQDIDREYLLSYMTRERVDRLLAEFRRVANLPEKAKRYPGRWEGGGINGHSLGHYLTACAACYAATGDPRAKERVDYIVSELAACQAAHGNGYVMTIPEEDVWTRIKDHTFTASGFDICRWWVPNYTIHKVFAGLRDAYRWTGSAKALEVEKKLGLWYADMISGLSDEEMQRLMVSEYGGLNETFADLYVDTGDRRFLEIAYKAFDDRRIFDPLKRGEDSLDGKHANTQMPKITGLATLWELTGDDSLRRAVETYWHSVVETRTLANGGHSDREHFYPMCDAVHHLGPQSFETCNINNMHRLSSHLFSWKPDSKIADFVELSLINQLLANFGRRPGEFGYFLSTRPVATKVFSTPEGAWWCCVGTGMENPMRYGEQAYFHNDSGVWVNLYMPSILDWREKGVKIEQITAFPESKRVKFKIHTQKPVKFELRLRKPGWCRKVRLNGCADVMADATGYIPLKRTWRDGDTFELELAMHLRAEVLPHSDGRYAAFLLGPVLLAGITPAAPGSPDPAKIRWDDHLAAPAGVDESAPAIAAADLSKVTLADLRAASPGGVMPLYKVYEEHYTMYFPVISPEEREKYRAETARKAKEAAELAARTVDNVEPGFQQSEVNHDYSGNGDSPFEFAGRKLRHATGPDAFISYIMAVDAAKANTLFVETCSRDRGRTCDIFADGAKIDTITLNPPPNAPLFYEIPVKLPLSSTRGKKKVKIEFRSNGAPGYLPALYNLRMER